MLPRLRRLIGQQYRRWVINFHFSKFLCYENAYDCHPMSIPSVSAVLFGFHGINMLKNLVSRELLRILENFHFSISISKHFDFTFHFSKKSESISFSLCTSRKRVKTFIFTLHFSKKSESFLFSLFTSHTSKPHSRWSLPVRPYHTMSLSFLDLR